ncbi:PREDICTED: uncharacterized protein LOC109172328 [Ipomoea nil]|uniref:uncharacterized protein LOC109172328 n=1 Tax=Ipomoea nil TaxID=35883 RepID=UPI000900C428|nr:PREDICTED: uncharacterized protein LOC109172328 [Ipomoea nil]XP_019177060.1 PREDICTED: uncharacterized protein LOC109172328 [Ipomoea nil]
MFVMDNPNATREYRLWFHAHGRRIIGNPEHRQDQGYIQTAASLNDTMHFLSQMNLGMEEAGDDPQRQSDWWRKYRVALPAHVEQAGYGFLLDFPNEMYNVEPVDAHVGPVRRDRRRERDHLRGQPQQGGRRRGVRVDEGMDASAPGMQHPAAADNVVGGDVDALALTIVPGQLYDGSGAFQTGGYTSFDQTAQFPHQTQGSFGQIFDPTQASSSYPQASYHPPYGYNTSAYHPSQFGEVGESSAQGGLNMGRPMQDTQPTDDDEDFISYMHPPHQ